MNTLVKICGITSRDDALAAVAAGAHALGFVFYEPSPRFVSPGRAREIIDSLPPFVTSVAVVVNMSTPQASRLLEQVPVNVLQLHGDETPELCDSYGCPYVKAVRARSVVEASTQAERFPNARAWLFDTLVADRYGGTGEPFVWQPVPPGLGKPVVLAGGLTGDNVAEAIRTVRPYAVDVSSGVEGDDGRKDAARMRRFVEAVRRADNMNAQ